MRRFTFTCLTSLLRAFVGVSGLVVVGCETAPWPVGYLTDTVGHATQEDVRGKLGAPSLAAPALDGSTLWTYHYVHGAPGSATYQCYEYALKFDQRGIFRSWVQDECLDTTPDLPPPFDQDKER